MYGRTKGRKLSSKKVFFLETVIFGKIIFNGGIYFQNPTEKYLGLVEDYKLESVRAEQYSFSY